MYVKFNLKKEYDMFKIIGVSTFKGVTKVRFANDMVSRVKILSKEGHTDINLRELDTPMSKPDAVAYLKTTELMDNPVFASAINTAYDKYHTVKVSVKKPEVSMDSLVARAEAVNTQADEDMAEVNPS